MRNINKHRNSGQTPPNGNAYGHDGNGNNGNAGGDTGGGGDNGGGDGGNDNGDGSGGNGNDVEKFNFFYHPDHLGSSSYITDANGEVTQHVEYFAFGEIEVE